MSKTSDSKARKVQRAVVRRGQASMRKQVGEPSVPVTSGIRRFYVYFLFAITLSAIVLFAVRNAPTWLNRNPSNADIVQTPSQNPGSFSANTPTANRIGIISGHRGNDIGTECQDGFNEAQLNFDHATRLANLLRAEGYTVDILDEFDTRLNGYRALVVLSIHADSCQYINDLATGFKVARSENSAVPNIEDKLVACLTARYKSATGLRLHANTITHDMTRYHGFRKIEPNTPGALIETGFLYLDRNVLTQKADVVARGLMDGLMCFLRDETL
jgi:N-acetylmuramoyl-L-alanine amidase